MFPRSWRHLSRPSSAFPSKAGTLESTLEASRSTPEAQRSTPEAPGTISGRFPAISRPLLLHFLAITAQFPGHFPAISRPFRGQFPGQLGHYCSIPWPSRSDYCSVSRQFPGHVAANSRPFKPLMLHFLAIAEPFSRFPAISRLFSGHFLAMEEPLLLCFPAIFRPFPWPSGHCCVISWPLRSHYCSVSWLFPGHSPAISRFLAISRSFPWPCGHYCSISWPSRNHYCSVFRPFPGHFPAIGRPMPRPMRPLLLNSLRIEKPLLLRSRPFRGHYSSVLDLTRVTSAQSWLA